MRIHLTKTCAGPQGSFVGGKDYGVPGEVPRALADALVSAGYGRWVEGPEGGGPRPSVEAAVEAPAPENAAERTLPPWTMKVGPEAYLDRWPDGPKADLARAHLED